MVEKLVSDLFIVNQNWAYLWVNSLNVIKFAFILRQSRRLPKYTKTKVLTVCFFYLIYSFFTLFKGLELISLPQFQHDF